MNRSASEALYKKAKNLFPGGVNSPVRAFKSVGGTPLFIAKGDGCRIWDADGNEFIDFCNSWGPLILGHNHPHVREEIIKTLNNGTGFGAPTVQENELGELILNNHRYLEKIRFVSSGTEAVMSAIRLARGATGRPKVIKFEGCYHGHVDGLLVKAGSGLATLGTSTSAGVPESYAQETIVLPLNDTKALDEALVKYENEVACIIIEPIPANNGLLLQDKVFLNYLREKCTEHGVLLMFDEVISGFRVGFEGASGLYGIQPDILSFGKIIGGGLPVGAYGASKELMGHVAPDGPVYQAGTLSGNPVAMSAGKAQLSICLQEGFYEEMAEKTAFFTGKIRAHVEAKGYDFQIFSIGSIYWTTFSDSKKIAAAAEIDADSMTHFKVMHAALLERGIYIAPSGYEVGFISAAHTKSDLEIGATAFCESIDEAYKQMNA